MTIRELRQFLFNIEEQDTQIIAFEYGEISPELIITIQTENDEINYKTNI